MQAPTFCDDVTIPAGATVALSNVDIPVKSVTFSGSGSISFTGNPKGKLAESLAVPAGVTLALDAGTQIYSTAASYDGAALSAARYSGSGAGSQVAWLSGTGVLAMGELAPELVDGVLTFNVPGGMTQRYTETLTASITKLVKLGAGTLVVSNDNNAAFAGTVEIREGILEAQSGISADGTRKAVVLGDDASNTITVSKGAQLLVRSPGPTDQSKPVFLNNLVLAGDGPDGRGALYYVKTSGGNGNVDRLFTNVTLTDNASVNSTARFGFSSGTLDLGGRTLTHRTLSSAHSQFMNTSETVKNGTMNVSNGSDYILQGSPKLGADATLVIGERCYLDSWSSSSTFSGLTVFKNDSRFRVGAGTEANRNKIAGPVRLDGKMYFSTYETTADMRATLAGQISGSGNIDTEPGSWWGDRYATTQHLYITCPTNNWTGGVNAGYGDIWATVAGSIPPGPITSTDGRLNFMLGPDAWDFASLHNILTNWNGTGSVLAYTSAGQTLTDDVDFAHAIPLMHGGPGTLNFTAKMTPDGKSCLMNADGVMNISSCGEPRYLSELKVAGGTMVLADAGLIYAGERDGSGKLTVTNKVLTVGGANNTTNARLIVRGNTVLGSPEVAAQKTAGAFRISDSGTKGAILELHAGATITNRLLLGEGKAGAVYQYGGYFHDTSTAGNDGSIGQNSGYGYYGLYDGSYSVRSWQALGRKKSAEGVFEQKGGTFTLRSSPFAISRGGNAEYHMEGGSFTQTGTGEPAIYLGNFSWGDKANGPMEAVLTLAGNNPQMTLNGYLCLSERTNTAVSVLNLNAGVLQAPQIRKLMHAFTDNTIKPSGRKDVYGYVNFNGGTVRASSAQTDFFGADVNKADAVTIFAGGATVDVNGKALSNGAVPFTRPVGKGVAAIALPSDAKVDGYVGAPKVLITGGGGAGATAHCAFDPATGRIGPITVVSPGWGFTSAPTVTIKSGDRGSTITCTATLTEGETQPGGGLTITDSSTAGKGVFTLSAANTYAGPTVVAGGTLKIGSVDALPADGEVRCAGGTLDLNNLGTLTFGAFGGFGSVVNGNVEANSLSFTAEGCNRTLTLAGTLKLPEDATVHVSGVTSAFEVKKYVLLTATGGITGNVGEATGFDAFEQPHLWRVSKSGNSIILAYSRGTAIILR